MKIWTVQPKAVYELINSTGSYHCDDEKSEWLHEPGFGAAYRWLSLQMARRIGPPPDGVHFPVWAWHTLDWEHRRPDMRRMEFRSHKKPFVLLEAEIDDRDVLLSDEGLWHYILNDWYLDGAENEAEHDTKQKWFASLPEDEQRTVKENSWEKIFDISPQIDDDWRRVGCYVQATFWELRKEDVTKVWHYG